MTAILYGQGAQTIRWVPTDANGYPRVVSSATYRIDDLREAEDTVNRAVAASTAATMPTVATTISAAAGPSTANPRRLAVTSATGVRVGGVYLLRDTTEARDEAVTVAKINGTELELTRPVMRAFVNGSAFLGLEIEGSFPALVANDELRLDTGGGPFQATWSYTIGSVLYVAPRELWLTRYGVAPWVRPDEAFRHLPGHAAVVGDAIVPEEAIRAATDDLVEAMQSAGAWSRDLAYFRGNMSADLYVRKRALVYMLRGSRSEGALTLAEFYTTEATQHLGNMITGRPPTRSVAVDPVENIASAGGETRNAGGIFART